jgi:DNA-binding transcriptional LysR family regulator
MPRHPKQGITLQHAVTVTQLATVVSFVRVGLGVAVVPAGAITGFNTDGLKPHSRSGRRGKPLLSG